MEVAAYLARIAHSGARDATRDTLAALVYRHALSIPFENIDAFLGRRISLDPAAVAAKLVGQRRGGWCFEQNLLMGQALRALGFEVTDLAARVLLGRPADAVTPRTHRVLRVEAEGRSWIVDVGFGALMTPTGLLDLDVEDAQQTPHETYRLARAGAERRLEVLIRGAWLPMFRFDLQPQLPIDFEAANFQLVHDPASHFTQRLGVSLVVREGRHGLRGDELLFQGRDGVVTSRVLTAGEILDALHDVFGIVIDGATRAALAAKLASQSASAARS